MREAKPALSRSAAVRVLEEAPQMGALFTWAAKAAKAGM